MILLIWASQLLFAGVLCYFAYAQHQLDARLHKIENDRILKGELVLDKRNK